MTSALLISLLFRLFTPKSDRRQIWPIALHHIDHVTWFDQSKSEKLIHRYTSDLSTRPRKKNAYKFLASWLVNFNHVTYIVLYDWSRLALFLFFFFLNYSHKKKLKFFLHWSSPLIFPSDLPLSSSTVPLLHFYSVQPLSSFLTMGFSGLLCWLVHRVIYYICGLNLHVWLVSTSPILHLRFSFFRSCIRSLSLWRSTTCINQTRFWGCNLHIWSVLVPYGLFALTCLINSCSCRSSVIIDTADLSTTNCASQ